MSDGAGGREEVIELPADVVLANTLFHPHLVADFAARNADTKSYLVFDGRGNAARETVYTRTGRDTLRLAGRDFDTVVLESVDRPTEVKATVRLDTRTSMAVQARIPGGRQTSLADRGIVQKVEQAIGLADLTPSILSKANVSIPNVRAISYMKVRAAAQPTGMWLTPDALNVPGQRFTGSVRDNLVEGVFEIEHPTANGAAFGADVGEYTNASRGNVVKVSDQAGVLTLEIPGKIVLSFKEPGADGVWRSSISDQVFATFRQDDSGRAVEMRLHEVIRLRRTGSPATPAADVPEHLGAYPGT